MSYRKSNANRKPLKSFEPRIAMPLVFKVWGNDSFLNVSKCIVRRETPFGDSARLEFTAAFRMTKVCLMTVGSQRMRLRDLVNLLMI